MDYLAEAPSWEPNVPLDKIDRARSRENNIALNRLNRAERKRKREKHICCGDHNKLTVGNSLKTKNWCPETRCALRNRLWNIRYINNMCVDCDLDM